MKIVVEWQWRTLRQPGNEASLALSGRHPLDALGRKVLLRLQLSEET